MTATVKTRPPRRREILDAALEVFVRDGYTAARIEDIRTRSGASVGSIYHHFGGKDGLAATLYLEGLADYQRRFVETLEEGRGAEATVKALVSGHLRWVAERPRLAAFLLSTREAEVRLATDRELRAMNRRAIEAARRWLDASGVRPMPTQLFYAIVIGPAQEFARLWVQKRHRGAMDDALRELPEAAWRAVRP